MATTPIKAIEKYKEYLSKSPSYLDPNENKRGYIAPEEIHTNYRPDVIIGS